jgi:predicted membrane chloride channel (bestrophin family)
MITVIHKYVHPLAIQSTLLTVLGTVLGFVISYRTTSSFERYNEGRRFWSAIIFGSRTFARIVWFHVPDAMPEVPGDTASFEERKSRTLVEKKTAINLIEAFAVAVKHYLRGEDGIFYEDLYHLVKFLPPYALPAGLPSMDLSEMPNGRSSDGTRHSVSRPEPGKNAEDHLPLPVTSGPRSPTSKASEVRPGDENFLLPARNPPQFAIFDVFPFSLLVRQLAKRGKDVKGKKAARLRAREHVVSHNIPLEISLYLSSYVAALQNRKAIDAGTTTALLNSLLALTDSLTGLERILTTPIPFSYSIHLWAVTVIYCLFLPFQILTTMSWITIPGTTVVAFVFFGFLVAGEEIENPFGYDRNDLNMDYFTHVIIRNELRAVTATPAPDPAIWAFSDVNDYVFASSNLQPGNSGSRAPPQEWMRRGFSSMQGALVVG